MPASSDGERVDWDMRLLLDVYLFGRWPMSRIVITDRERVAVVALERIAARGVTFDADAALTHREDDVECPDHIDRADCDCGDQKCPECGHLQMALGVCANRDCLTAIARAALDELRRAP